MHSCYYLEKKVQWRKYNSLPGNMTMTGLSGLGTEKGVYSFSKTGSAFLPKGSNTWRPLSSPIPLNFHYSCPVQISKTELLIMGGNPERSYGKQVWKLDIEKGQWEKLRNMTTARHVFGCSLYRQNGQKPYLLVAGKIIKQAKPDT